MCISGSRVRCVYQQWSTVSADLTPMINWGMVFCDR